MPDNIADSPETPYSPTGDNTARDLWDAELWKPWPDRQYFHAKAVALRLSRKPGRLETDEDEAYRILQYLSSASDRGEFADDELVVLVEKPPHFVPAKARLAQECGSMIPLGVWRDAILMTRRAVERFLRGCGLAGAPRLLAEWGFDVSSDRAKWDDDSVQTVSSHWRTAYENRVAELRETHHRDPPIQTTKSGLKGDREWAAEHGIPRPLIEQLRREKLGPQRRGRPQNPATNSSEQ